MYVASSTAIASVGCVIRLPYLRKLMVAAKMTFMDMLTEIDEDDDADG